MNASPDVTQPTTVFVKYYIYYINTTTHIYTLFTFSYTKHVCLLGQSVSQKFNTLAIKM